MKYCIIEDVFFAKPMKVKDLTMEEAEKQAKALNKEADNFTFYYVKPQKNEDTADQTSKTNEKVQTKRKHK